MNKLMRFFIICSAVFMVGLVMTVAGACTGGVNGFNQVAEDHDWISGSPGARTSVEMHDLDFDSIEAIGYMDVVVADKKYFDKVAEDYDLSTIMDPEEGCVIGLYGSNLEAPSIKMDGKTLKLQSPEMADYQIGFNFSDMDAFPTLIVFCSEQELKSIHVNSSCADVDLLGISFKQALIENNYGDLNAKKITSQGIRVESDAGDVSLSGNLKGITEIIAGEGDIDITTKAALKDYTVKIKTESGDVVLNDKEIDVEDEYEKGYSYTQKGGTDSLILKTDYGDITLREMGETGVVSL